jgi:hypothetical protein
MLKPFQFNHDFNGLAGILAPVLQPVTTLAAV